MDNSLKNKKIILIIGGGIAAYKSLDLIRLLKKQECEVKVVLTESGKKFVTPLSIASYLKIKFIKIFLIVKKKLKWIIYHYLDGLI